MTAGETLDLCLVQSDLVVITITSSVTTLFVGDLSRWTSGPCLCLSGEKKNQQRFLYKSTLGLEISVVLFFRFDGNTKDLIGSCYCREG